MALDIRIDNENDDEEIKYLKQIWFKVFGREYV